MAGKSLVRVVIADDERLARQKMRILLEAEPSIAVVAECQDGRQTVSAINCFRPDLLLLDIQMPDLDGFQVLNEIPPEEMPLGHFHFSVRPVRHPRVRSARTRLSA